ncbi:MAG: DNA starvation/stationary phase protection protein [Bifidobacteriaceae bacterium]|jgi:starvation-inducible DNA-binding protein|nr:DNA starvation/stationary phase protection protein [Bifidobacteriaceae bacterium]
MTLEFIVPGLGEEQSEKVVGILQTELEELNDLALLLKHAHWNVKGKNFIAVHEMLDPQIDIVRDAVDTVAERIATLGGSPNGTADAVVANKNHVMYPILKRECALEHLKAVDSLYVTAITALRKRINELDELDVISSNILQDVTQHLELFQWFMRSHLV